MKNRRLVFLLFILPALALSAAAPLRVLILSGENNHNWKLNTPEIAAALNETGRFKIDIIENVPAMTPKSFNGCDVIVSNYNTFKKRPPADEIWKADVRDAFINHIRQGAGFVVVHAGSSGFYDWPEYQDLAITSWTLNQTKHGKRHANLVTLDPAHPITKGIEPFWTFDEFWENVTPSKNARRLGFVTPLAEFNGSGKHETILFAQNYGKGRGVCLLLGHDVAGLRNPGFKTLLQRSTEWAATNAVTLTPESGFKTKEEAESLANAVAEELKTKASNPGGAR